MTSLSLPCSTSALVSINGCAVFDLGVNRIHTHTHYAVYLLTAAHVRWLFLADVTTSLLISQMPSKHITTVSLFLWCCQISNSFVVPASEVRLGGEKKDVKPSSRRGPPAQLWFITSSVMENGWVERAVPGKCTWLFPLPLYFFLSSTFLCV